jgi:hypothetical protein
MNIILDVNSVEIKNVSFLDSKKNIIVNGKFTRLMYSNSFLTMSGLYINFPINLQYINTHDSNLFGISRTNNYIEDILNDSPSHKNIVFFNVNNPNNVNIIKQICDLEYKLLNYYKSEFLLSNTNNYKSFSLILNKQLSIGKLKLYKELNSSVSNNLFEEINKTPHILFSKNSSSCLSLLPPPPPGFSTINYSGFYNNSDCIRFEEKNKTVSQKKMHIVLKISGIWETKDEIGLTYKFLESYSI